MEYNASSRSFQKPFRFQTSQQKRLFTNLRLLGPGPATFYREARSLMLSHQEFASVTHLVAHLLREIESAVRQVLLPYNFAQPEECKTCGNRPEVHAKQIEAIVQSLELNDSVQEKWKEIATRSKTYNGLAAFAHREDLSHPRKLDASFEELVSAFEDVFNLVLAAFEQQSMHVFALLDSLLKQDRPSKTKKHLSILRNKVPHNDATHRYFFERLQSPGWLDPLYQEGFFLPPPTRVWDEDLDRPVFSAWAPVPYLLRMASVESAQHTVLAILHDAVEAENPFIRSAILQIAKALPATLAATLVPAIQKWMLDPLMRSLEFSQIGDFTIHLIQGDESDSAVGLVETCGTMLGRSTSHPERWDYEKILTSTIPLLVKSSAVQTLSMLCRLLETAIYDNYIRFRDVQGEQKEYIYKEAQGASTRFWQRALDAKGSFPAGMQESLNLLVATVRLVAEQSVREHLLTVETVVSLFEGYSGRIFRRFALYLLSCFPHDKSEIVSRYLIDRRLFDDDDVRHEYELLAHAGFTELPDIEQEQLLQWIEAGPDLQSYRERYEQVYHLWADEGLVQQYANTWRRHWFGVIVDGLPGIWKVRFEALVAEVGPIEPEETDPPVVTWVGPTSTLNIEELRHMSIDQLLSYLRDWQPSASFMSPSREGLGRLLTTLVSEEPGRFAEDAFRFQECDPIYISAVVQGFTQGTRDHRQFGWEHVLNLCQWIVEQRYVPSEDGTATTCKPPWEWTSQMVANLLLSATEAQPPVLPYSLRTNVWDVIKLLVEDPDPRKEDEVDEAEPIMEFATRAINSVRGIALHAVVQYAWWVRRLVEQEGSSDAALDFSIMPEVRSTLERHIDPNKDASLAVRSVYGQHLTNMIALDAKWTGEHLTHFFPSEAEWKIHRAVTWNTYIVFCEPFTNVLRLLHDEYAAAIEQLDSIEIDQGTSIIENPHYQLGEHLIRFYWSGLFSLESSDSLLKRFFAKAPDTLRGQVFAFIGRAFYQTGEEFPLEFIERCQRLWEWRLTEAQAALLITSYEKELAAFGWWFRTEICPSEWGMQQLEAALILVGYIDLSYAVVERLARLVEQNPAQGMRCLERLIKGDKMMWTTSTWEKAVRPMLTYALQQEAPEARRRAKAIISTLALQGMIHFIDLLPGEE
jgi:hypothetical protein